MVFRSRSCFTNLSIGTYLHNSTSWLVVAFFWGSLSDASWNSLDEGWRPHLFWVPAFKWLQLFCLEFLLFFVVLPFREKNETVRKKSCLRLEQLDHGHGKLWVFFGSWVPIITKLLLFTHHLSPPAFYFREGESMKSNISDIFMPHFTNKYIFINHVSLYFVTTDMSKKIRKGTLYIILCKVVWEFQL